MRCTTHRGIRGCAIAARPLERLLAFDEWQGLVLHLTCSAASSACARRVGKDGGDRLADMRHGPRASAKRGGSTMPGSTQPQRIAWTPSRAMSSL